MFTIAAFGQGRSPTAQQWDLVSLCSPLNTTQERIPVQGCNLILCCCWTLAGLILQLLWLIKGGLCLSLKVGTSLFAAGQCKSMNTMGAEASDRPSALLWQCLRGEHATRVLRPHDALLLKIMRPCFHLFISVHFTC